MKYSELLKSDTKEIEIQEFLMKGNTVATMVRILKNLKDSATESAVLQSLSFSSLVRMLLIENFAGGR